MKTAESYVNVVFATNNADVQNTSTTNSLGACECHAHEHVLLLSVICA